MVKGQIDFSEWTAALERLDGPMKESLARQMAVAGGQILRDEAKALAPHSEGPYNPTSWGSQESGTLSDNIYLAFDRRNSVTGRMYQYKVSWSRNVSRYAQFVEFGHWQPFEPFINAYGAFSSRVPSNLKGKSKPGKGMKGHWVAATPFLGPAYSAGLPTAHAAMIEAGRRYVSAI